MISISQQWSLHEKFTDHIRSTKKLDLNKRPELI